MIEPWSLFKGSSANTFPTWVNVERRHPDIIHALHRSSTRRVTSSLTTTGREFDMKHFSRNITAFLVCVCALAFPVAGMAQEGHSSTAKATSSAGKSAGSEELHRIMMESHQAPMQMTGDVDRDFASMMSMHHEQGIKMADVLLEHGKDPSLKAMAQKMKDDQRREIGELAPYKTGR